MSTYEYIMKQRQVQISRQQEEGATQPSSSNRHAPQVLSSSQTWDFLTSCFFITLVANLNTVQHFNPLLLVISLYIIYHLTVENTLHLPQTILTGMEMSDGGNWIALWFTNTLLHQILMFFFFFCESFYSLHIFYGIVALPCSITLMAFTFLPTEP